MAQCRLHYAGSTFELRDETEGKSLLAKVQAVTRDGVNAIVTVNLIEGTLQLLLSRYVSVAVSVVAPEGPVPSAYESHGLLMA